MASPTSTNASPSVASFAPLAQAASTLPAADVAATAGLIAVSTPEIPPGAQVLTVGVGKEFSTVAAAIGAAHDGAVILVDAGTYTNDFATVTSKITLVGVGGMVNMVATVPPTNFKGILTVDNDVTVRNFSFSGSAIPDAEGGNGAGIRYEGGQMVLVNDVFSNNQNGVMGAPACGLAVNTVSIDHCVFSSNGSGSGYTHNVYIGAVSSVTATNSVFEYANVGHEFKSRALVNNLSGNVFRDGPTGTASYDIDLPDGGNSTITNNIIEKGPNAQNSAMVHFGGEGIPYAGSQLTITGNQFQNDKGAGVVGLLNQTAISATISGNSFANFDGSNLVAGPATETNNTDGNGVLLPNSTLVGVLPGSTLIITDALAHSVTLTNSLQAVEGGAGLLTAYAQNGHVVAIGGSGGMNYSESPTSGGNQITTAAGSVNTIQLVGQDLVDSEGTDTIVATTGNTSGVVNGTATIADGTANNQWTVNGTATITGQGGNPVVNAGAHANIVINGTVGYLGYTHNGGAANIDITQGGAEEAVAITGGALSLQVYNSTLNITTAGGTAGALLRFGAGAAQVVSNGNDVIWAGSGSENIIVSSAAQVHAGTGTLSLFDHGNSGAQLYGNGGTYLLGGDTGGVTYYGGSLASTLNMHLSNNTLVGGSGQLTVDGGSNEQMQGGAGGLIYSAASDNGGGNTITTAVGSSNTLTLAGPDVVSSWGTDTISGGIGNQSMAIHGNSVVYGSSGNSSLTFWGHDTLYGKGQDSVAVQAGADVKVFAGSLTSVTESGGKVRFHITDATGVTTSRAIVYGGSASISNNAGVVAVNTNAGSATNVLMAMGNVNVTSNSDDTIQAVNGQDTVTIDANNAQVWGGAGSLIIHNNDCTSGDQVTVHGGSGTLQYDQGPGKLVFIGGTGSAVVNGEYGSLVVQGGAGNLTVSGGSQGLQFVAGSGTASVALTQAGGEVTFGTGSTAIQEAGWGAAAVFNFVAGHGGGTDVISGFRAGIDQLVFQGVTVASTQSGGSAQAQLSGSGAAAGGTILTLSDGTHVDLAGVTNMGHLFG